MSEPLVVADGDDRAARMLADPRAYFARARARAQAQIEREVRRAQQRPRPA